MVWSHDSRYATNVEGHEVKGQGGTMQVLSTTDLSRQWPLSATRLISSVKYASA